MFELCIYLLMKLNNFVITEFFVEGWVRNVRIALRASESTKAIIY